MKLTRKNLSIIFTVLTVAVIIFIWTNSIRNGDESNVQSKGFVQALGNILAFVGFHPSADCLTHFVRKAAHMTEFAGLAFICSIAVQSGIIQIPKWRLKLVYPLFCALLVAAIDEFIQRFSYGRTSDVRDVLIDFGGAVIGTLIASAALYIYRKKFSGK